MAKGLVNVGGGGSSGGGLSEATFTKPTTTILSTQRAGTGTIENITNGVRLRAPGTSDNTNGLIYAVQTISNGTGGYSIVARFRRHTPLEQWGMMGMILRNSSDGKSVQYWLGNDSKVGFNRNTFSNDTTWASVEGLAVWNELDFWMKITDNLTNRIVYVSKDGNTWQQIYTESHDTYVAANQAGIAINPNFGGSASGNVRTQVYLDCYSWTVTAL